MPLRGGALRGQKMRSQSAASRPKKSSTMQYVRYSKKRRKSKVSIVISAF